MQVTKRRAFLLGVLTGIITMLLLSGVFGYFFVQAERSEMQSMRGEIERLRQDKERFAHSPYAAYLRGVTSHPTDAAAIQKLRQSLSDDWPSAMGDDSIGPIREQQYRELHEPLYKNRPQDK